MIGNEYGIKTKTTSPGNLQENAIVERIYQVIGNLLRTYNLHETYVYDADQWMGILSAVDFVVQSRYHRINGKSPGQIVFGRDMILPINHVADWRYICQIKQAQIDKYVIHENTTKTDHDYIVGDKVMTQTRSAYKLKTPFRGQYENFHTWTNGTFTLRMGAVKTRRIIRNIKPYNIPFVEGCDPPQKV